MLVFKYLSRNQHGSQLLSADYFQHKTPFSFLAHKGLSRSSISEARDKLSWEVFPYLLGEVPKHNYKWKGHTLRAVDGTHINLPKTKEVVKDFPVFKNAFGEVYYPSGHLVAASNVLTGQITNVILGNKYTHESSFLKDLLTQFKRGDISLLDRGFSSKGVWLSFNKQGQYFVGRFKVGRGLAGFTLGKKEQVVEVEDAENQSTMRVRILRGCKLKTGSYLYVVTNLLDAKKYTKSELLDLYKKRVGIEKNFEELKNRLGLSGSIRVKKLNLVLQEIFAAILAQSLVAVVKSSIKVMHNKVISFKGIQRLIMMYFDKKITPQYDYILERAFEYFYHYHQVH